MEALLKTFKSTSRLQRKNTELVLETIRQASFLFKYQRYNIVLQLRTLLPNIISKGDNNDDNALAMYTYMSRTTNGLSRMPVQNSKRLWKQTMEVKR